MILELFFSLYFALGNPIAWQVDKDEKEISELLSNDYLQIQNMAQDLLQKYSPQDYLYVGIGSSPAPLSAFFKTHYPEVDFLDIPMKGLNFFDSVDEYKITKRLKEFLDPSLLKNKKGVVVIDFVYSGTSLQKAIEHTNKILNNYHVQGYGLFYQDGYKESFAKKFAIDGFDLTATWLGQHMMQRDYTKWSPYKSIHFRAEYIEVNTPYQIFLQQMYIYRLKQQKKTIVLHTECRDLF